MLRRIEVRGRSMEPTFRPGQRAWAESWSFRWRAPRAGDVVLVDHPHRPLRLVKRVAAVPGEEVEGRRLGPDEYYVVGDNPEVSTASEAFGPVPRGAILARVMGQRRERRTSSGD